MAARRKARKRALDVLYEAELRGTDPVSTAAERVALANPPMPDYAVELVEGVVRERSHIDELITAAAQDWTLERMPAVDRTLLRIAVFELFWCPDVPDAVAMDEAIELAKELSTDDSPRFVNGVLGRVARQQAAPPDRRDLPEQAPPDHDSQDSSAFS
ncbi:MAG TPA: transcription antitermination factor NusB [Mycobacteriales bacterium]|nr:transcription antitermination factor NusB [Mycobacteriales bacterium]